MADVMGSREAKYFQSNLHTVEELKANVRRNVYYIFKEHANAGV
jgi:hypothetical protein